MDVLIDGIEGFKISGDPDNVLEVFGQINTFLKEKGLAIVSVEADGVPVTPDNLIEHFEGAAIDNIQTLRIGHEDIESMVRTCLEEMIQVLPELSVACRNLAEIFHSETPEDGYEPFQELADIWLTIKNRQRLVANIVGLELESIQVEGQDVEALVAELNGFLAEAAQALEDNDTVLLGDLLEYELAPRAEKEAEIVDALQQLATTTSG